MQRALRTPADLAPARGQILAAPADVVRVSTLVARWWWWSERPGGAPADRC